MKYSFSIAFLLFSYFTFAQIDLPSAVFGPSTQQQPDQDFYFVPNLREIKLALQKAPRYTDPENAWIKMKLPLADGVYRDVEVAEAPVVSEKTWAKYPENRSYKVRGIKDKHLSGRMSITPKGITALFYHKNGNVFIEPTETKKHRVYAYDANIYESFSCGTDHSNYKKPRSSAVRTSFGSTERKYIIAIASSGEFSAKHGNNLGNINAIINDYLTLLNTIYERDLAITFELTPDNDDIVFFDPNTDGLNPSNNSTKLSSAQSVIGSTIGSANYDIGHVFYEMDPPPQGWWGSGVASLGVVCSSSTKARGWTGCGGPYDNSFWMGIFAHEVGHQFDATHSFYGTSGNCGGSQRSIGNGVEPGSGNSLMSYEGSCGAESGCSSQNITPYSSFYYFHGHTIEQVNTFVNGSANCYESSSTNNSPPVITMPASKTIPKETPFYLEATVTDPDGDPLLISWEEIDTDNLNLSCPNGAPNDAATSTTAPLFRSFDPSEGGNIRYFPQLNDILDDTQTMGEILPEVGRDIDMRCTARGTDANGISGVTYEDVTITVAGNAGPFEVTTASSPISYQAGDNVTIQWLVNNTNIAPVSCTTVNILFSNDGGNTFPITLASSTANDGSQTVSMPLNGTEQGRIKIEAADNIFFSINKGDITIISDCQPKSSEIINNDPVTADAGDPSLNLDLTVGQSITTITGDIDATDPSTNLIAENLATGSCAAFTNMPQYETMVLSAATTDVYTFTSTASYSEIINIYQDEFIPPATNCQNWLASSLKWNPFTITNTASVSLNEGDVIEMVLSGFSDGNSGPYTVDITSDGDGVLVDPNFLGSGYVYKFVMYNSSNIILAIENEADLSDANIYSGGVYTVKGLYTSGVANLTPYIGQDISVLEGDLTVGTVCGELSSNEVTVTVNGCTPGTKLITSPLDNGTAGTLRYEIENACEGDIIQFSPSLANFTIFINGEISLAQDITITGLGMNSLSLSGNNLNRIFNISSGVQVEISNLTLKNGYAPSNGGALFNQGSLSLSNVKFEGNASGTTPSAFTNQGTLFMGNNMTIME